MRTSLVLALALGSTLVAATPEDDAARGEAVIREADRRGNGFGDLTASLEMVLVDRQGRSVHRRLRPRVLEVEGDGDKSLILFDEPADVEGTALLTHSHLDGRDDQWLFLPAVARVKRIAAGRRTGPFLGSEFSFEDLSSPELPEYHYRFLRDEPCGPWTCAVVERISRDPDSGYSREAVWIDLEHYRYVAIDFVDRKGEPLKRLTFEDYREHRRGDGQGTWWRPDRMSMVNHQTAKRTELHWADYRLGTGLDHADFDQATLPHLR